MNTKRCNKCGKELTRKEGYYSVSEIEYNKGDVSAAVEVLTSVSKDNKTETETIKSWVDYTDLDFCEECWKKEGFQKYTQGE